MFLSVLPAPLLRPPVHLAHQETMVKAQRATDLMSGLKLSSKHFGLSGHLHAFYHDLPGPSFQCQCQIDRKKGDSKTPAKIELATLN